MIDKEDIKLRSLANKSVVYKKIYIRPKTIEDIVDIGYDKFNERIYYVGLSREDVFPNIDFGDEDITLLELLFETKDNDFIIAYLESFSYFISRTIAISLKDNCLVINNKLFPFSDLNVFTEIIKIQNYSVAKHEDGFNPLNERAEKLRERILARQKKLKELKQDAEGETSLSFMELISILASNANGINITNVFKLNFYQFNDQFNRMKIIDDYEVNIQALLHGADSKAIKLKHWISKIE